MNKPKPIALRSSAQLRALLAGGHKLPAIEVRDMARWAIFQELETRESDEWVMRGLLVEDDELEEKIEELEGEIEERDGQIEELKKEHAEEILEIQAAAIGEIEI